MVYPAVNVSMRTLRLRRLWTIRMVYHLPLRQTEGFLLSLAEKLKTIIGRSMRSRTFDGQRVEVQLARKILNTMTLLGMPDSYRVE